MGFKTKQKKHVRRGDVFLLSVWVVLYRNMLSRIEYEGPVVLRLGSADGKQRIAIQLDGNVKRTASCEWGTARCGMGHIRRVTVSGISCLLVSYYRISRLPYIIHFKPKYKTLHMYTSTVFSAALRAFPSSTTLISCLYIRQVSISPGPSSCCCTWTVSLWANRQCSTRHTANYIIYLYIY
jgi:hypothetical protein